VKEITIPSLKRGWDFFNQTFPVERVITSFTGKDLLRTRLQAGNLTEFSPQRSVTPAVPGTNITREGRFGFQLDNGNNIYPIALDGQWDGNKECLTA
jgi:hypothetical protein